MARAQEAKLPAIAALEDFGAVVGKLERYISKVITAPFSFEELRTVQYAAALQPLVKHLVEDVRHLATVHALLVLKGHYGALEDEDDRGIVATRGLACELVAWRFVSHLSERDAIDYLCTDLVQRKSSQDIESEPREEPLLDFTDSLDEDLEADEADEPDAATTATEDTFAKDYHHLNALEIAAVSDAKKFLSQRAVQRIIDGIWRGEIMFWQTMSPRAVKQATLYHSQRCDPFTRLRVPLYLKSFEVLFFAAFLAFYYTVLVQKSFHAVTTTEIMLYLWLAAFTYNELGEMWDAGFTFYAADFWAIWDLGIILTGLSFMTCRIIGLKTDNHITADTAFDILALEALLLVPRICSLLSLHPYFGTLLPCLKEMTKDFIKFLALVFVLYLGFNTTFGFLARGTFSFSEMSWILIKVFFGSSYLGFDVAEQISPTMGPPLMLIFCVATNFLLLTILICLLSKSYDKVMEHARDEYLFVYAVYVLEASTSNRLTYFVPPLNLLPLLLRPLRLFVAPDSLRACRIAVLKATHWPLVALIVAYESARRTFIFRREEAKPTLAASVPVGPSPSLPRRALSSRSVRPPLVDAAFHSPPDEQAITGMGVASGPQDHSNQIKILEALSESLQSQLRMVDSLIENEKARTRPPNA